MGARYHRVLRQVFLGEKAWKIMQRENGHPSVWAFMANRRGGPGIRLTLGFDNGWAVSILPEVMPNFARFDLIRPDCPLQDMLDHREYEVGLMAYWPGHYLILVDDPLRHLTLAEVVRKVRFIRDSPPRERPVIDLWAEGPLASDYDLALPALPVSTPSGVATSNQHTRK